MQLVTLPGGDVLLAAVAADSLEWWRSSDSGATWILLGTRAAVMESRLAVLASGSLLLLGGRIPGNAALADVWRSDAPAQGLWWERTSMSLSARRSHGAVVLSSGRVIVAGGFDVSDALLSDVVASDDEGLTWFTLADDAGWSPRAQFGMVALPDDSIVVAGGFTDSGPAGDVWRSLDGGVTFEPLPSPSWPATSHILAVAYGGSITVLGTNSTAGNSSVFRSVDRGVSWTVASDMTWEDQSLSGAAVLGDGSILVSARSSSVAAVDKLWKSAPLVDPESLLWSDEACYLPRGALCTALPGVAAVSVSIPARVGDVSPRNAASPRGATAFFAPPSADIRPASETAALRSDHTVSYDITFSSPVSGLAATDIAVLSTQSVLSRRLQGHGKTWSLQLELDTKALTRRSCPEGYSLLLSAGHCARVLETLGSWSEQQTLCLPYTLAIPTSVQMVAELAQLRTWNFQGYWVGISDVAQARTEFQLADGSEAAGDTFWGNDAPALHITSCGYLHTDSGVFA